MSTQTLVIDGYGEVPPVMQFIPNHAQLQYLFGLYVAKGTPHEVVEPQSTRLSMPRRHPIP